jgi:prepilin-type N-terminal cleavage/methylation domain-containing protein
MIRLVDQRRPRHCRPRAFTIPELLFAIGILGIFAAAATQLFHATFRINHATAQEQDAAGSFDSAVAALRADAWVATEIAAPGPTTAKLGKITWTINETTLTRDAGDGSRPRIWTLPQGVTFAAEATSLVLRVPAPRGGGGERGGDVRMVSQVMTLSRLTSS